ncbi:TPA: hypothetical protein N6X11_004855 [Escherichia coli]|nr:hypothetical protein [Escherichia coli]
MDFKTVWNEYAGKIESGVVFNIKTLTELFCSHGINNPTITLDSIGNGLSLKCFRVECDLGVAFFPFFTIQMSEFDGWSERFSSIKSQWEIIDWFIPPYLMNTHINNAMSRVFCDTSKERALDEFEHALPSLYTMPDMCTFVEQVAPNSRVLNNHVNTLRESILSFYTGYKSAATASLIPIVESALVQLADNQGVHKKNLKDRIEGVIKKAIDRVGYFSIARESWVDDQFRQENIICKLDNRAMMLRIFGDWLKNSFFSNSDKYNKKSGLNRHIFSHGLSLVWQRPANFHRLIGVLNNLVFLEYYLIPNNNIDLFYPEPNEQSLSLLEDVNLRIGSQMFYSIKSSDRTLSKGTKMPILTCDDGWFFRAGRLSAMCMSGLVEKLRDNNWKCTVHDPVQEGEYIIVDATKNNKTLKIGLLYTCATSNSIYQRLDIEC